MYINKHDSKYAQKDQEDHVVPGQMLNWHTKFKKLLEKCCCNPTWAFYIFIFLVVICMLVKKKMQQKPIHVCIS